jgi:hypothetical protein
VIPAEDQGVVNRTSFAYRQTDEEVLNSLLAFSKSAPSLDGQYLLDKDPKNFTLHCGLLPKPWQGWQRRHLPYYDYIVGIVEWAQSQGYKTPFISKALQRKYRPMYQLIAMAGGTYGFGKSIARRVIKA